MLNARTAIHNKRIKAGDFEVVEELVHETYRVLHRRAHLVEFAFGEVPGDCVQEKQEMLAHSKGGRRWDSEDIVGEDHVEAVVVVGEAVNNIQAGMRTLWMNKGNI